MACAVGMHVLMFVKDDGEATSEGIRDSAECLQARNVIAPLQAGDHRLRHPQAHGELLLGFARLGTQIQELPRTLRGEHRALIQDFAATCRDGSARTHMAT